MAKKVEIEQTEIDAPYELPDGWKWCRLGEVADWGSGGTPSRKNPEYYNGSIPWIKTGELNESYIFDSEEKISEEAINHSSAKLFPKETVVLAMYGATIGKTAIFGIDASTNQACACAICHKDLDNHYLFNFLKSKKDYFIYNAKGGAQPNISQEIIKDTVIPLPPTLAEQKRIVNRIESMFAKLDEAKEKAQAVLDNFETRKAAILHKAFTGELTANWRKENGVDDDSWVETKIGECCIPRAGYAFDSKKFVTAGFQIIRMGNLYAGELNLSRNPVFYSDNDLDDSIKKRALIADGDILITLTGTKYKRDYGYAVRIDKPNGLLVNQRILCLTPKNVIKTNFLLFYLHSNMFRDVFFSNETGGVNQGNVSSKFVESISFRLPSLPEQQEIVQILDAVLEKETRAKEAAQTVLEQIALLKKSILARAFRGEL